jgi:diaminohydroxyphosphoribosylaminopyrimidine deaminase/5-amino-6-(5-phosphoribosylamino)uracil reductase
VTAKIALSADGFIAPPAGQSPWITSPQARHKGHELRWRSEAILVGAETIRADNPRLTVRRPGRIGKIQPWRVILTRSGRLPSSARVFRDEFHDRTLVFRKKPWDTVLRDLAKRDCKSVMLEGGGKTLLSALQAGVVNEAWIFISPRKLGRGSRPLSPAIWPHLTLKNVRVETVGPDILFQGLL